MDSLIFFVGILSILGQKQSELENYFIGLWVVKTHVLIRLSCLTSSITHAIRFSPVIYLIKPLRYNWIQWSHCYTFYNYALLLSSSPDKSIDLVFQVPPIHHCKPKPGSKTGFHFRKLRFLLSRSALATGALLVRLSRASSLTFCLPCLTVMSPVTAMQWAFQGQRVVVCSYIAQCPAQWSPNLCLLSTNA